MKLHEYLESTGTSQRRFAELTGIQQPLISRYARELSRPDLDNAVRIARASKGSVPVEEWFEWKRPEKPRPTMQGRRPVSSNRQAA